MLSVWRFDPDTRVLRTVMSSAQSRPFALLIKSQVATGPLPLDQELGLWCARARRDQVGLLGVATRQRSPARRRERRVLVGHQPRGLPVRRARTRCLKGAVPGAHPPSRLPLLDAGRAGPGCRPAAVEPTCAWNPADPFAGRGSGAPGRDLNAEITRAGIFKLTFRCPPAWEVETVSGGALSHWTELRADGNARSPCTCGADRGHANSFSVTPGRPRRQGHQRLGRAPPRGARRPPSNAVSCWLCRSRACAPGG